jgi:mannose-1-phosphate guanylyltransferase
MSETLAKGPNIQGNVIIHPTATVASNCLLGPNVVVGANCHIGEGVRIKNSSILDSVLLEGYNVIDQTIVGWESRIGKWVNRCSLQENN